MRRRRERWGITPRADLHPRRVEQHRSGVPDLTTLLGLRARGESLLHERVALAVVEEEGGGIFECRRADAPVLLLGDSYPGIYANNLGGNGRGAGLAGSTIDVRQDLAARMARGEDRLAGKKVVVCEFVERELANGDWPLVELPSGAN